MSTEAAPALQVHALQLGPIATNCYVAVAAGSSRAVVIDPGAEPERVQALLEAEGLELGAILVTHCHWDHIGAVAALADATGAPVWMSATEAPALERPEEFAFPGMPAVQAGTVDHHLDGDEQLEVEGITFSVLPVPGHSPGHLAFLVDAGTDGTPPVCFVGDVIFRGSVGRTDLPYADGPTLERSHDLLVERLAPETVLLSGHGEPTTMAAELATNPFLRRP